MSEDLNIADLEVLCLDYAALAGGGTTFWIEDLNGNVVAQSRGTRKGRTARSALMRREQVRYAACALGPSANSMVPFFARACQREMDHQLAEPPDAYFAQGGSLSLQSDDEMARLVHDLNNLLGTITGNAELLESTVAGSGRALEQVARISRSSRLARLFVARLGNMGKDLERTAVDLGPVVTELIELTGARTNCDVCLVFDPPGTAFAVEVDLAAIQQLLLCIISSALSDLDEDGVMEVRLSKRVSVEAGRAEVVLCVRDNGCGMDDDTLAALRNGCSGTLLADGHRLALASRIVADHGGSLDVGSTPGRGTRVEIVFPACAASSTHAAGAISSASHTASTMPETPNG